MRLVSAAHGRAVIFTVVFSCSFPCIPTFCRESRKGPCSRGPGGILGLMSTLCPLNLKHCSSEVEMIEREIPEDLIEAKSYLNLVFVHLQSRYLIICLNTCTFSRFMYFNNTMREYKL